MKSIKCLYIIGTLSIVLFAIVIEICDCYIAPQHYSKKQGHLKNDAFSNNFEENDNSYHKSRVNSFRFGSIEDKRRIFAKQEFVSNERIHTSYFFPIFPQFHDVDYNDAWNFIKNTDTIIFFVAVHIIGTFFTILTWILIHSLVWDGELTRDEDLFFPLNILADVLKGADIASFNVEYNKDIKDKKEPLSIDKSNLKSKNSMEKTGIRGNSLAEISVNNLINFLVNPNNAMTSLTFSHYLDAIIMILWFLPTFLWTGEALDESDRPFKGLNKASQNMTNYKLKSTLSRGLLDHDDISEQHKKKYNKYWPKSKSTSEVKSRFVKLYNKLLCPQCIAMQGVIQGVVLVAKLIFFSIMGLLPREDFPPNIITPGFISHVIPLFS